jgi:hypothetical protein
VTTNVRSGDDATMADEVNAPKPRGEAPETTALARLGAVAAVAGAIVLLLSTLLHPLDSDPNVPRGAFDEYAADSLWVWSHLGQFLGVAFLGAALAALAGTLAPGRSGTWARIGLVGTAAGVAVAAVLQAVDGVALKVMVDRWAAATGEGRGLAFEAALAVRQIEIGLASLFSLVMGLTVTVFGIAMIRSTRFPSWVGAIGLLGGAGLVAAGAAQGATGFSPPAMALSMLAGGVLLVWIILVAAFMWRLARR